ncbi:unnamed protein product [Nesidiocoris tenuis]|uniref:RNA helicase n=1 Tax=Nesidiocoris tenuis TaxID=355587 RepID=A0A6H5GSC1_9HEMI|nr:unnamed protein product [Nesidiocoris tenuis]
MSFEGEKASVQFHEIGLDDRILKAIAKLGWAEPSLIQEKAIPLFLDGKDVLMKARTGSGKTGAFTIPVIQRILSSKEVNPDLQNTQALILAPTKELSSQIHKVMLQLTSKCSRDVRIVDISSQADISAQKPLLVDFPDIVIATPGRAVAHLKAETLNLKDLKMLVIDEADLMFSCGYEEDVKQVLKSLPKIYQAALASATLSADVLNLKKLVLHNAVTLKLQESELAPLKQLTHYKHYSEASEKHAVLYSLLKLGLIRGKSIIFVNTVDKCYRLKLFLDQFKISSCILNSELPAASRCHAVAQFNEGVYDIIIASEESFLDDPSVDSRRNKDKEFGLSRGIDFQHVSNIINYEFPESINSYIHRAGRTARGSNKGFFEENPKDLRTLRHDKKRKAPKTGQHISNVPDYLVPNSLKSVTGLIKIKKAKKKFVPPSTANKKYEVSSSAFQMQNDFILLPKKICTFFGQK